MESGGNIGEVNVGSGMMCSCVVDGMRVPGLSLTASRSSFSGRSAKVESKEKGAKVQVASTSI
jgi:hypothetical protein